MGSWRAFWGLGFPGGKGGRLGPEIYPKPPHPPGPTESVSPPTPRGGGCRFELRARVGILLHLRVAKNAKEWTLFSSRTMAGRVSGARRHRFQTGCPGLAARICHCEFEPYTLLRPRFLHISFKRGPMKNSTVCAFVCAVNSWWSYEKRGRREGHDSENLHSAFA